MTALPGAALSMVVLSASGCLPVVALVGPRWFAVPLCPLLGAVVAAAAATMCLSIGGSVMAWFVVLSVLLAVGSIAWWWLRPDRRPWIARDHPVLGMGDPTLSAEAALGPLTLAMRRAAAGYRVIGVLGAVAVAGACAWCLQALSTPAIGFDARAIWVMRAGWLLQPHHQLLVDMSSRGILLPQTSYPPLTSAAVSVGWYVTGTHSMRLGVVIIALLNVCALAASALAVVECGRLAARKRLLLAPGNGLRASDGQAPAYRTWGLALVPYAVGAVVAPLLVLVTFGVTGPFMTNGYADPIWSISAVGAVAFGLQMPRSRSALGAAAVLVGVAGSSKEEGAVTAVLLVVLLVTRRLSAGSGEEPGSRWRPLLAGWCGVLFIASWPVAVRLLGLRHLSVGGATKDSSLTRAHQAFDGLAPHLHLVLLALSVAAVGALLLRAVRRATGIANDGWAWAAMAGGLLVLIGAYVAGTDSVPAWVAVTHHRVTEFPALCAWWIIGMWAVTGSATPALRSGDRASERSIRTEMAARLRVKAHASA